MQLMYRMFVYAMSQKTKKPTFCDNYQIFTNFQNLFTFILNSKFATEWSLKIPPHLKRIVALSCEILMSEN